MSDTPIANTIRALQARLGRPEWWTKGEFHRGEAACLEGAIRDVKAPLGVWDFIEEVAQSWASNDYASVTGFNDWYIHDHDELLLFLDAALDVAEAEGI